MKIWIYVFALFIFLLVLILIRYFNPRDPLGNLDRKENEKSER